jgi:hypothetical protein
VQPRLCLGTVRHQQPVWPARRDFVKKVALYRGRLAVQLPNRIVIYELADGDDTADDDDTGGGRMQVRGQQAPACTGAGTR